MLARLQRRLVVLWLLGTLVWVIASVLAGAIVAAVVGAAVLLGGHAIVLALEFVLMAVVNRRHRELPARVGEVVRAWWRESTTAPVVFCWRQPFRSQREPDFLEAPSRRGVVLVHGFVCNRGLWNPWMRVLRAWGIPFIAVNLEPVFGSINRYPPIIDAAVRRLTEATGQAPLLVGHSMGGLAIRAWLDAAQADARVHHVVTIGTPHHGTWLGTFAHSENTRQMARLGGWVSALASRETAERRARFTCFYGHCDNIVFPASTATLADADNRHIAGCPHVAMAYEPEVLAEVLRRLELGGGDEPAVAGARR